MAKKPLSDEIHLVFISTPGIGNLVPTVEFAQYLLHHHPQFSVTIIIFHMPHRQIVNAYSQSLSASITNIRFIYLPTVDPPSDDQFHSSMAYISLLIENHKPHVKQAVSKLIQSSNSESTAGVAGLFVNMLCTSMIDVAGELGVPSYLFFQSPATFFSFMLDLPSLDEKLVTELSDSDTEFRIRGFENSVPRLVLPNTVLIGGDG